jgi:choice-of-anchor A domain-containing protein/LPXTG-motif cell wall-anchored protein
MRGLKKKLIATIASVAVLAGAFTIITKSTYASYDGNEPFLQGGIEFGILANYINQTSDMETNFFAGKYQGNGKHNGNTVPSKANGYGEIRIGELVGELKLRDYDKNKVTIDKKYIREVKDKLASIGEYAESVVNKSDYKIPDIPENTVTNNYYIDISAVDKDVVYVNMDRAMEAVTKGTLSNGAINFTMRKDQTIVLNVTENLELYLPRYIINIKDGSLPKDELAANVIWNMPYLNNLKLESNNMDATVIAPKALVNLAATAEGWLVCDQVVCNNGEWHMIYKGFGKTTKAPTATPTKEPTKEPAKTPKATPTEEPTKAPVKTPSVTSTSEPTKEPTKAPTETPKVTPTVEPTATPEATATPTIAATITPTAVPTATPTTTVAATATPTVEPTATPTIAPTATPTVTAVATATPFATPTVVPTATPFVTPTVAPTATSSVMPSNVPSVTPTAVPTGTPFATPTVVPAGTPTVTPNDAGATATPEGPTATPTANTTATPTVTNTPATVTEAPTATPTADAATATPTADTVTASPSVTPDESMDPATTPTPTTKTAGIKDNDTDSHSGTTTISDDNTPLSSASAAKKSSASKKTSIVDDNVPLSDSAPATGDETNLFIPILAMGASVLAIMLILTLRKKSE